MDISHEVVWGYRPLVVSVTNIQDPLWPVNRRGNRPSSEGVAARFDQALALCHAAGFRRVTSRDDTDFSQTEHLDRWDAGVRFVFGCADRANLMREADALLACAWIGPRATRFRPSRASGPQESRSNTRSHATSSNAAWEDQQMTTTKRRSSLEIVPNGDLRAGLHRRFPSLAGPQTYLFWD